MKSYLILLLILIQIVLISSLFIPILLNIYQIISVSILITYISWQSVNVINRYLLPNTSLDPRGRSVLITGCDSGFGYSTALRLQSNGFHVFATVLSGDSEGSLDLKANGIKIIELNVLNENGITKAFDLISNECEVKHLKLWAIVNNAGVYACGELEWGDIHDFETLVQINIFGYIRVLRTFLPLIRKSKGRIINISSVASLFSAPGTTIYSMSKAAISSLTDGIRREFYNKGVEVIEIIPQAYKNTLTDRVVDGLDQCWKKTNKQIKNDFGEEYYLNFRNYIARNINSSRDKPEEVVDAIVKSVSLRRVHYKYLCCGPIDRLILWSFYWVPIECLEPIVSLFTVRYKPLWTQK